MIALHLLVTFVGVALGVFYPFISVILAARGFSPSEIGLVFSIGAVGFTLAVPAWGHLADVRLGRPRTLQIGAVGAGAAVAGLLLPSPALVVGALLLLFWIFESSWQPLADAITVNALRGRDYARVRLFMSLGFAGAAIASGYVYDALGYDPAMVFLVAAAAMIAVSAAFVPDAERADLDAHRRRATRGTGATGHLPSSRRWPGLGSAGVALRVAPRLGAVLVATVLLYVGIISGFTFLPLRIEALGGTPSDVALSAGLSGAAEVPGMLVMGVVVKRLGLRAIFAIAALVYGACMASWMVLEVPGVIVATRVLTGLAFAGVIVSAVLTIARLLPRDLQGTGQALLQTSAFGVGAVIANMLGGLLYESFGHAALFGVGALLAVVAAAIGWLGFPRRDAPQVRRSST